MNSVVSVKYSVEFPIKQIFRLLTERKGILKVKLSGDLIFEISCFGKIFYLYQLYLIYFYDGKSQVFTGNDPVNF